VLQTASSAGSSRVFSKECLSVLHQRNPCTAPLARNMKIRQALLWWARGERKGDQDHFFLCLNKRLVFKRNASHK
jgi:hypothetical protein